jgi:hypothetical protein
MKITKKRLLQIIKEEINVQQIDIGNNRFQINLDKVPGPRDPLKVRASIIKLISSFSFKQKANELATKLYNREEKAGAIVHGAGKHHGGKELLAAIVVLVNRKLFNGHKVFSVYEATGLFGRDVDKSTYTAFGGGLERGKGAEEAWQLKEISGAGGSSEESTLAALASLSGASATTRTASARPIKKPKIKLKKFKGVKISHESTWPDQIKRQIAHLRDTQDRWFGDAGINENFLIVDDRNKKLYVFSPEFKLLANLPVITGRDSGEEDILEMKDWLMDQGWFGHYKQILADIDSGDRRKISIAKREKKKIFNMFLNNASKTKSRVTPSGVFTLANLKKGDAVGDKVAYGTRKYSLRPGADAFDFVPVSGIALHGTGIGKRKAALRQAVNAMNRGQEVQPIVKRTPSYGCINVANKYLQGLDGIIEEGSQVFVLPEDGSIVEVGRFENFGHYLDAAAEIGGKCIDAVTGKRSSSAEDIKRFKKGRTKKAF